MNEIRIYTGLFTRVTDLIEREYGITAEQLKSPSRKQVFVGPRHVAMWLVRQIGRGSGRDYRQKDAYSYPQIVRMFGRNDHTTVMHACQSIERDRSESATFRQRTDAWVA